MTTVLFLSCRMSMGFGVSVVIWEISKKLIKLGYRIHIGCLENDQIDHGFPTHLVAADSNAIRNLAQKINADLVIAHTSPYFEALPALTNEFKTWAWEHGDPCPEFFTEDQNERINIIRNKQINIYPNINGVIAISEFIKSDIKWPFSLLIPNGCDHVKDFGPKGLSQKLTNAQKPLLIGTLMRLGNGEAKYKGNQKFIEIYNLLKHSEKDMKFFVMGRGEKNDAKFFEDQGITVYRNVTDEFRSNKLRECDIFISCSLWEGFNLPLIEAQASGTIGLAFDTGSHPEVTPFIFSDTIELADQIKNYSENYELLLEHSNLVYHWIRSRYTWEKSCYEFSKYFPLITVTVLPQNEIKHKEIFNFLFKVNVWLQKTKSYYHSHGLKYTLKKILNKISNKLKNRT